MTAQPPTTPATRHTVDELGAILAPHAAQLTGSARPRITCLGGHASYRIYFRAEHDGRSFIVMELGGDPLRSEEISAAGEAVAELPFLAVQRHLRALEIAVPEVHAYLPEHGLVLLEDLGDETLEAAVLAADPPTRRAYYARAIRDLIALQRRTATPSRCICYARRFDHALLRWELDHFREWLLEADRGVQLAPAGRAVLDAAFDRVAAELAALPPGFVHRDYQSRNLMVQRAPGGGFALRLIDFQDALLGPPPYDLVALLRDSYVDLGVPLVHELLELYVAEAELPLTAEAFRRAFWLQTVQRKLKDAGRFVFIDRVKHNPSFLRHVPVTLRYVAHALSQLPELGELAALLGDAVPELRPPPQP